MHVIPLSNLLVSGAFFLVMLVWAVIARTGWIALRTGRAQGPISRLHPLLGIATCIAYFTAALSTLAPDALDPDNSILGTYMVMANDLAGFAAVALFRHMAHYFEPGAPILRRRWLLLNYGSATIVSLIAMAGSTQPYDQSLGSRLYGGITYGYMALMFFLSIQGLRKNETSSWKTPFGATERPLRVVSSAAVVLLITVSGVVLTQSSDAKIFTAAWTMALFGALVAAPFAIRNLGAVLRDTLVALCFVGTGIAGAFLVYWETSFLPENERFWMQIFLGSVYGLLIAGAGLQACWALFDRIIFRRAHNKQGVLREALHALSPALGTQQCSVRALAALTHAFQLEGAGLIWRDGGAQTFGKFRIEKLEEIWPRGEAADALAKRTLAGGELTHLPEELRGPRNQAHVVGVVCVRGSRRLWGHILMRTDLVGSSFGSEELSAIEGFADQLGLLLDGADMLGRTLEVERSLAHAEKLSAIGELTARVAHEIRNPATAARSLAQQLVEEPDSPYQQEHTLIVESLDRIENQVALLLRYAKRDDPTLVSVDLAALTRRTAEELRPSLRSAGIELIVQSPAALSTKADAEKLRLVMVNLIENARDALADSEGTKEIRVAVSSALNKVSIEVTDTGPGVAAQDLDNLFESFFTTKETGTGLGLAISKRTIEAHGGEIRASQVPGSGLSFQIDLPMNSEEIYA
jgi:signal transduction histidine kinase